MRQMKRRRDPAPSMLRYRLNRLWLTPAFQACLRIGPLLLLLVGGSAWVAMDANLRASIGSSYEAVRASIVNRDEFRVAKLHVRGGGEALSGAVSEVAKEKLPASSLDLDVAGLREQIRSLPAVSDAAVRIVSGGVLQIDLTERVPVMLWRSDDGLFVLGQDGEPLGTIEHRADRPDLPLILGQGAAKLVPEALDILVAAGPIAHRVRGLQRVSGRRWNLMLDRDQVVMLPQERPRAALRRVMGLHQADDILERDILVVDVRNGARPILRLGEFAQGELKRLRAMENGDLR